jgi:hypothetical protein
MAVRHGYGKIAGTDALVFAYDTGDIVNSFKGKPGTNILKFINQQYSNTDETYFKLTNGVHDVYIPTLGTRTVKYVDIWNDYSNGSGRCCLSLFSYGTGITAVQPSTTYMYQVVYKTDTGYSHPNYMYRYEYGASGYIKEGGLHSTSRRTALGDGWYHGWGSFTTDANTTYINTYLFHYEYATQNKVQVAAVSLTEGTEIIPPKQFIGFEQTRSATQGLLDLTGNSSVDLSNVNSYDSQGIIFDGTDDKITMGTNSAWNFGTGNFSIEVVFNMEYNTTYNHFLTFGDQYTFSLKQNRNNSDTNIYAYAGTNGPSTYSDITALATPGNWNHLVFVRDVNNAKMYLNGVYKGVKTGWSGASINGASNTMSIGNGWASEYSKGVQPVTKLYNRALTATEIEANFNHYKTRFNIA